MSKLRGGSTIGGFLATHFGNFKTMLSNLTTVTLTGDTTGTGTFDENGNLSITTTVGDNSHSHDPNYVKFSGDQEIVGDMTIGSYLTLKDASAQGCMVFAQNSDKWVGGLDFGVNGNTTLINYTAGGKLLWETDSSTYDVWHQGNFDATAAASILTGTGTILTTDWIAAVGVSPYAFYADILDANIGIADVVDVNFPYAYISVATTAVIGVTEAHDGFVRVLAVEKPTESIQCDLVILKGV